jgi:hypothetical protein
MLVVVEEKPKANERPTVIKLGVTRAGKEAITEIAKTWGMKEQEAAGRIYEWFVAQDDVVQRAVLGLLKGLEKDAAKLFMQRLAKGAEPRYQKLVGDGLAGQASPQLKPDEPDGSNRKSPASKRK